MGTKLLERFIKKNCKKNQAEFSIKNVKQG